MGGPAIGNVNGQANGNSANGGISGIPGGGAAAGQVGGTGSCGPAPGQFGGDSGTTSNGGLPGMPTAPTGQVSGPGTGDGAPTPEMPGAPSAPTSASNGGNVPESGNIPTSTTESVPVSFLCSVKWSEVDGGNLASVSSLYVEIYPANPAKSASLGRFLSAGDALETATPVCSYTDAGQPVLSGEPKSIPLIKKASDGTWSMRQNQNLWLVADYNPHSTNKQYPARPS